MNTQQLTMKESLEGFLRTLEGKNRSAATLKAYKADILQFFIWLADNNLAATTPDRIVKADITDYLAALSRYGLSGVSRARKLAAVREYFRYLLDHGHIEKSPAQGIETPKREKKSRNYLHPKEYNQLLGLAAGNPRDYAILQVFLQTGLRVSELVHLGIDDIDLSERTLHVRVGKGMAERTLQLEKKVHQALKSYLAVRPAGYEEHLFLNRDDTPLGERGVEKLVTRYTKQAGFTKRITPHSLRHTFATAKAGRGVNSFQLRDWLGHKNLNTTQIYVHLAGDENAHKIMEQTSL